ncbi:FAD-dependent oxidoreductase [Desulfothermobacter acidiphilus]|uniref:FAD-dependent oxidoreductase n=1 Tax=Desulfothermobacter acidiphilus TaxID=1938353 RepID=UPI003F89A735
MSDKIGAVMVVGGGVAGIQAALDLAESGYYVYLVERSPAIGGVMAQLDKTFPTNDCSMCILAPKLVECGRHPNVQLVTNATITGISGEPGNFTVSIKQAPRYVDITKCVACGDCAAKCPVKVKDEFNEGLGERKAIFIKYSQAVPAAYMIDASKCLRLLHMEKAKAAGKEPPCGLCAKACQRGAINFDDTEKNLTLNVGSIVLAPGFDEYVPNEIKPLGYGVYPNVVTSIEFERILSASGPYGGHLVRPSDRKEARKIAWIQCVGSRNRNIEKGLYCSSVCCTYAIKEAMIAKEHSAEPLDTAIFYMDMRTYGKGFEAYYEKAKKDGIRFIRARIFSIEPGEKEGDLCIRYADESGEIKREDFDMVVLSVGLRPAKTAVETAKVLGLELNHYDFCKTLESNPVATSRPGIFVCGTFRTPMDIPQTVMEASAAAAAAQTLLSSVRGSLVKREELPPERDVTQEEPRIGVFVCHCGINIGGVVNVPEVTEYAKTLPNVVYAANNLYTCSQDTQQLIQEKIKEHNLNRVVVAACTPRTHEPLFQATIREAGLNPFLFAFASLREQVSWVHMKDKEVATQKAKDLVRAAVSKVRLAQPLSLVPVPVNPSVLVIGGGAAGMTAALELANQGFKVDLVEKDKELGGLARRLHFFTPENKEVAPILNNLIESVKSHPNITVHLNTKVVEASGYVGNFVSKLSDGQEIHHGATVIAIGGREYKPTEYLYGQDPRVVTQLEFEEALLKGQAPVEGANTVAMINCVGSREEPRMYCSRVCCTEAIRNALKFKEKNPQARVYILYRDIRTYGLLEDMYCQAREKGIVFIRYSLDRKPQVEAAGDKLRITTYDPILREELVIDADVLALSAAVLGPEDAREVGQLYKVTCGMDDFYLEAHMKLRPVDFATDGVFLCGLAHAPKFLDESVAQAKAAAARAATVLTKDAILAGGIVSKVDPARCSGCRICVNLCPYNAITFDEVNKVAVINEAVCKGCGVCAAACPSKAITMGGFTDEQVFAEIEALLS